MRSFRESRRALLLLGTRKAESQRRAAVMAVHDKKKFRARLTPNASLPNSLVYTPIEDWTNDDVWLFLMQVKNPWGTYEQVTAWHVSGSFCGWRMSSGCRYNDAKLWQ
ncbi:MAG: phosphoadenosine phosphosulfate reductase family protein [Planctomycetaceae bacterium]